VQRRTGFGQEGAIEMVARMTEVAAKAAFHARQSAMQTLPEMKALTIAFEARAQSVSISGRFADCLNDLRLHAHLER
jgi:hypothetical protein